MTSTIDEKNRDHELGTTAEVDSQNIDISPEKSKEETKDGKDDEEKESKGSIKDYFVSIHLMPNTLLLTGTSESSNTATDSASFCMAPPASAR